MVTGKIIKVEFSYPVYSVFVNFTDDKGDLPQPQVQQIAFSGDTFTALDTSTLTDAIKEYITLYETALAKDTVIRAKINTEFDINGEIIK